MFVRVALALLLLFATPSSVGAEDLEEVAREAEHMVEDVAKARSAAPGEARALAKEIADHAAEADEALEQAAGGAARSTLEGATVEAKRVVAAAQAVQRASDADVRARVGELRRLCRRSCPS